MLSDSMGINEEKNPIEVDDRFLVRKGAFIYHEGKKKRLKRGKYFNIKEIDGNQYSLEDDQGRQFWIGKREMCDKWSRPALEERVNFIISSFSSLAARGRDDVTAQVVHTNRLREGAYGTANLNVVDTAFQNTSKDFGHLTLGATRAHQYREQVGGARPCSRSDHKFGQDPIFVTRNIMATEGTRLNNTGESFHIPVAYGRVKVNVGLLDGFNPTQADVYSVYGSDWNAGVSLAVEDTKFLTYIVAVAHGPIDSCELFSNHSDDTFTVLTADGADEQTTYIRDSANNKVAAITFLRGSYDQSGFSSNALSWRDDARGVGTALAMVTLVAYEDWPAGIPQFTFIPNSTRIRQLTASGFSSTRTARNDVPSVIGDYN